MNKLDRLDLLATGAKCAGYSDVNVFVTPNDLLDLLSLVRVQHAALKLCEEPKNTAWQFLGESYGGPVENAINQYNSFIGE